MRSGSLLTCSCDSIPSIEDGAGQFSTLSLFPLETVGVRDTGPPTASHNLWMRTSRLTENDCMTWQVLYPASLLSANLRTSFSDLGLMGA